MKKILSLVLAVVMIMAIAIPAFAASEDEVAPCAICNGNHTYEEAYENVTYSLTKNNKCLKTTIKYYKCVFCPSTYAGEPVSTTVPHVYDENNTCIHCGYNFTIN